MRENSTIERINRKLAMVSEERDIRLKHFVYGIVVVPILLTVLGLLVYAHSANGTDSNGSDANLVVAPDNIGEVTDSTGNAAGLADGSFETSMTTEWHFSTGDAMSEDAYVQNVLENTNDIYFEVALKDNADKVIYKSPIIPRGSHLENIVLDEYMAAGTYDCVLTYYLLDDVRNPISSLQIDVLVIVAE